MHIAVLLLAPACSELDTRRTSAAPPSGAPPSRASARCLRGSARKTQAPSDIEEEPEPVSMEMPEPEPEVVDLSDLDPPSDIEQEPSRPTSRKSRPAAEWKPVGFSPKPPPAAPAPPPEAPAPAPAPSPVACRQRGGRQRGGRQRGGRAHAAGVRAGGSPPAAGAARARRRRRRWRRACSRRGSRRSTRRSSRRTRARTWTPRLLRHPALPLEPFFAAGRAVCADGAEAARYDWLCEQHRAALSIATIGAVRQIVSDDKIVSEFETAAGAVPFLTDFLPLAYSAGCLRGARRARELGDDRGQRATASSC